MEINDVNKGHQRVSFKLLLTVGTKKKRHSMKTYLIRGDNRTMETGLFDSEEKHQTVGVFVYAFSSGLQVRGGLIQNIFHRPGQNPLICHMH